MQVITDIYSFTPTSKPRALTIGNFDGLHLGHLSLLEQAHAHGKSLLLYTFTNHPTHVLSHLPPIPYIYTLEHKLKILKKLGVDCTILTTFTKEFSQTPFDVFLKELKETLDFSHLIHGKGDSFGKDRRGDEAHVRPLAKQLGFEVTYIPKRNNLSSGHVRTLIAQGAFAEVEKCLGRPYSIYAPILSSDTPYMQLYQHCLPPSGTYPMRLVIEEKRYVGTANIDRKREQIHILIDEPLILTGTVYGELFFENNIRLFRN